MRATECFTFEVDDLNFELEQPEVRSLWLEQVLKAEKKEADSVEYVFCSDEKLLEINRQYLDHDYFTDIITFPLSTQPIEATIFISIDRVRDNALTYGVDFYNELDRVLVHGLLHMIGYDDTTVDAKKLMREMENHYLSERKYQ